MDDPTIADDELAELRETFAYYDRDGNNTIDSKELSALLQALGMDLELSELKLALDSLDADGNGVIEFEEFVDWWVGQ